MALTQTLPQALIGDEWLAYAIHASHPTSDEPGSDGAPVADLGACRVVIDVQRRLMIFVIKQIVPTAIVVIASMISLYLSAQEHTGDRTGMILVGALILIVNFQVVALTLTLTLTLVGALILILNFQVPA